MISQTMHAMPVNMSHMQKKLRLKKRIAITVWSSCGHQEVNKWSPVGHETLNR